MPYPLQSIVSGAAAGAAATVPMSLVMLVGKCLLPWTKRDPLPPAQIMSKAIKSVGLHDDSTHAQRLGLTVASHFGYGATMGAIYGEVASPRAPAGAAASGVAFGLGVWSASYLGLLPMLGLYRSATDEPAERNTLMIAAHIVWGASLGLTLHYLARPEPAKQRQPSRRFGRRVRHRLRPRVDG